MRTRAIIFSLFILSASLVAHSQTQLTGKYEGTADIQSLGKLNISAEIREKGGNLSGIVHTPLGDAGIMRGSYTSGVISLTIDAGGDDVVLDGKVNADGSLSGTMTGMVSGNPTKGVFELRRVGDLPPETDLAPKVTQSKDKWREDLRFLATELPKRHKNAFGHITKQQWEAMVADLDTRIPTLSDDEIVLGLERIGSSIGDGHTGLVWARHYPRLPLRFFWFGKDLRVTVVSKEHFQLAGSRVTRINGIDVDKIYESSRPFIAQHESEEYVLESSAYQMTYPVFLKNVGAGRTLDTAVVDYVDQAGQKGTATLKASHSDAKIEWVQAYKAAPLYLQHLEKALYFEYIKEAKTLYVNFKHYPRRDEFRKFSADVFKFIDGNDVAKLVFDLRLNGGGDFTRGRDFFIKPLKERKQFLERGRLFVLIGRRTYSAGMANAADFRNDLKAILVGEPTGARPNGYQENRGFTLPNSKLDVSYSIELYKFSETDTPGIIPDQMIRPDWKSYVEGRDPALQWILDYPAKK